MKSMTAPINTWKEGNSDVSRSLWQAQGVYPTPSGAVTETLLGNRTIPIAALPLALKWELMWT